MSENEYETFGYAELFHRKRPVMTVAEMRARVASYQTQPRKTQLERYKAMFEQMSESQERPDS